MRAQDLLHEVGDRFPPACGEKTCLTDMLDLLIGQAPSLGGERRSSAEVSGDDDERRLLVMIKKRSGSRPSR